MGITTFSSFCFLSHSARSDLGLKRTTSGHTAAVVGVDTRSTWLGGTCQAAQVTWLSAFPQGFPGDIGPPGDNGPEGMKVSPLPPKVLA